jgi:hypothetical protein
VGLNAEGRKQRCSELKAALEAIELVPGSASLQVGGARGPPSAPGAGDAARAALHT